MSKATDELDELIRTTPTDDLRKAMIHMFALGLVGWFGNIVFAVLFAIELMKG